MHAIIYGSGKWSQILQIKLKSFGFESTLVGNNTFATKFTRENVSSNKKGIPVFVASATKDHLADIIHSSRFEPNVIFVEKGFASEEERIAAEDWSKSKRIPIYILSQYRYSKVFDILEPFKHNIVNILHEWTIEKGLISEWVPHIMSIDNYIKNNNNHLYVSDVGSYVIDKVSSFRISKGEKRELKTIIKTKDETIIMTFGTTNTIYIKSNHGVDAFSEFQNEDCITTQLKDIIINTENLRLERL